VEEAAFLSFVREIMKKRDSITASSSYNITDAWYKQRQELEKEENTVNNLHDYRGEADAGSSSLDMNREPAPSLTILEKDMHEYPDVPYGAHLVDKLPEFQHEQNGEQDRELGPAVTLESQQRLGGSSWISQGSKPRPDPLLNVERQMMWKALMEQCEDEDEDYLDDIMPVVGYVEARRNGTFAYWFQSFFRDISLGQPRWCCGAYLYTPCV